MDLFVFNMKNYNQHSLKKLSMTNQQQQKQMINQRQLLKILYSFLQTNQLPNVLCQCISEQRWFIYHHLTFQNLMLWSSIWKKNILILHLIKNGNFIHQCHWKTFWVKNRIIYRFWNMDKKMVTEMTEKQNIAQ